MQRLVSESGFYHVMLRGNGRQILFEDDGDRIFFLRLMRSKMESWGVVLLAWCLMDNHVHLLVEDPRQQISQCMHGIATAYARRYNEKEGHIGAVFQGRFASVAIKDERQLLCALRYIHENPASAGICAAEEYRWSSYHEYIGEGEFADTSLISDLLGSGEAIGDLSEYGGYYFRSGAKLSDEEVDGAVRAILGDVAPASLKAMEPSLRDAYLRKMRAAGMSARQMERRTGIGRDLIYKRTNAVG